MVKLAYSLCHTHALDMVQMVSLSDTGITLEDYVDIKKHEYESKEGHEMGDLDLLRAKAQFQCMDINGDGQVDWWEFVKQETCKKLAKRCKVSQGAQCTMINYEIKVIQSNTS